MSTDWLHGALGIGATQAPFPWQVELLRRFRQGEVVSSLDIPTGVGKTAVMAVWLVARALGASLPRRLVYVVDRRAVVDQATEVAEALRGWVAKERGVADALGLGYRPLPISTLRGQHVDNRTWLQDPSSPAIVVGTVDMVGSRLLFSGYGVSPKMRPYHAGLLGADALVVLDEAHLVPAFEDLLRKVERGVDVFGPKEPSFRALVPPFKLLSLSATGRHTDSTPLTLTDDDRLNPSVSKRLNSKKTLSVVELADMAEIAAATKDDKPVSDGDKATKKTYPKLADVLAKQAWERTEQGSASVRCLVFCDSRKDATAVAAELRNLAKSTSAAQPTAIELFVGGRRVRERTMVAAWLVEHGFVARRDGTRAEPRGSTFLVATSAGEVGVDMDADHMVCDLVAWERMVQRLGRVNRCGDGDAKVVVVAGDEPAPATTKAKEALQERVAKRDAAKNATEERPRLLARFQQLEQAAVPEDEKLCSLRNQLKELGEKIAAVKDQKKATPKGKGSTQQDKGRREALQQEEKKLHEDRKRVRDLLKKAERADKERFKRERENSLAPLKRALKNCDGRIKAFKDSDAKIVARRETEVAQYRALRTLLEAILKEGGSLSPDALIALRNRQDLADALRAATTVEPLRPELTRPLVDAWSMTSLDEHPGRPEVDPWLRGFRPNELPQTTVVWRRYLPVRTDEPFDAKAARRFFEAAPPHRSELLETDTHLVLGWLIERATRLTGAAGEASPEAKQVVAIALGRRGEPKGWRLSDIAAAKKSKGKNENKEAKKAREQVEKELENRLSGAMLVIDSRLGGLSDGLLSETTDTTAEASDDGFTRWLARPDVADVPVTGFRVRALSAAEEDGLMWRTTPGVGWVRRHLFVTSVVDGEPSAALVIDGWAGDAATEDERAEADRPQQLDEHQSWAEDCARQIARRLGIDEKWTELLAFAARLHDEGKRAAPWQRAFNAPLDGRPYAKTKGPINFDILDGYRHELGSLPYVETNTEFRKLAEDDQDLVLHLIAAHHGFARPVIGTSGCDDAPPSIVEERARGRASFRKSLEAMGTVGARMVGGTAPSGRPDCVAPQPAGGDSAEGEAVMTRTTASIPVDLKSPGQVLACMGFLEAAEVLLGGIEAHFDWSEAQATFVLCADGDKSPFAVVLEFLAKAEVIELTPIGYVEGGAADGDNGDEDGTSSEPEDESDGDPGEVRGRAMTPAFPSGEGDRNALPIQLVDDGRRLSVSHWADGSSRDDFKLYSGNRSANRIATQMLQGVRAKPKKNQSIGDLRNRGLQQLWQEQREALLEAPFDVLTPMGGSFNFDPRGGWTAIDAGYSPNTQKDGIAASPVVEILAAVGLEHTRPMVVVTTDAGLRKTPKATYAVWGQSLPPMLARAALVNPAINVPKRRFSFDLRASGKNKIVTFAQEEPQ